MRSRAAARHRPASRYGSDNRLTANNVSTTRKLIAPPTPYMMPSCAARPAGCGTPARSPPRYPREQQVDNDNLEHIHPELGRTEHFQHDIPFKTGGGDKREGIAPAVLKGYSTLPGALSPFPLPSPSPFSPSAPFASRAPASLLVLRHFRSYRYKIRLWHLLLWCRTVHMDNVKVPAQLHVGNINGRKKRPSKGFPGR